ncbi:hypothetical protein [Streptacidiphilus sp. EB129]|uniref:hypothetical protein n=1 Tax=Streptacidiphilus sp. EB129 TaxID=3156262 RepID=UPI003519988C
MADADIDRDCAPRDTVPQDAVPQDVVPGKAVSRRLDGLRDWWEFGSTECSTPRSVVTGAIIGFCLALTICAHYTGHSRTVALMLAWSMLLSIPLLACLWWTLEQPKAGLSAMLAGALLAAGTVLVWGEVPPGQRDLAPAWSAATEQPLGTQAVGSWATGDLVVRVRPDRVVAYRAATGTVAWTWTPPGQDVVCAMSRATGQNTGLLGHAAHDRPCGTAVALNLATGAPRWDRDRRRAAPLRRPDRP